MTDIVERLRTTKVGSVLLCKEAALEIERLRAVLERIVAETRRGLKGEP